MEIIQVTTASEMDGVAQKILDIIASNPDRNAATVITFQGDLGAGKTTLVQALAGQLDIKEQVTSPTYVVMKSYDIESSKIPVKLHDYQKMVHIDAYRIEDVDEMRVLKFPELLNEKNTIICIEWPEHIASLLPKDSINVSIEIKGEERMVTIS